MLTYPIQVEVLSLEQAEHRYYSECPLRHARDNLLGEVLAVSSCASVTLRHGRDFVSRRETIFIFLLESLLPEVPTLARSDFSIYNDQSKNLLDSRTYVEFSGEHVRLRLLAESLGPFIDLDNPDGPVFDVVYVCGPLVFISTHRPSAAQADDMTCDLQACCISAGINYRPHAIWSDEQLEAAAQERDAPLHGLLTAQPFQPKADWRTTLGFPSYM